MRFRCGKWTQRKKKYFQFKSSEKANRSSINIRPSLSCDFLNFLGKFKIILFLKDMTGSFFKKKFRKFQEIQEEKIEKILEKKKFCEKNHTRAFGQRTARRTARRVGRPNFVTTPYFFKREILIFSISVFFQDVFLIWVYPALKQGRGTHHPPPTL